MPQTKAIMISFSRLQNISRRGGSDSGAQHDKASSQIQGSFAESISMEGDAAALNAIEDCDASSCSSSSDEELTPHLHSSQQGSFPSCPPSVEQKNSGLVVSMPLPVVFEEDECETSVSNIDEEEEEDEQGKEMERAAGDNTKNVHVGPQENDHEAVLEDEDASVDSGAPKLTKDTIESGFYSSAKTVSSNTDATCQTAPISISLDSTSEASAEIITTTKSMEDELDSRLHAILALKEVVFTQRMAIKETTKDKQRLISKVAQRDRINTKLLKRNKDLERQLASLREQLDAANLKLSQKVQEEGQNDPYVEQVDDDSTLGPRKEETIFELLHRMNERRKKKKSKKAGESNAKS